MTAGQGTPGRPRYTEEQRRAASDRSFLRALPQPDKDGHVIPTRTHITGYDGKHTRIRIFAWNYYHPENPSPSGNNIYPWCMIPKCIAKDHLRMMDVETKEGETIRPTLIAYSKPESQANCRFYMKRTRQMHDAGLDYESNIASVKSWGFDGPVPEESEEGAERIQYMIDYVCQDDEDHYRRIAYDWGIIRAD